MSAELWALLPYGLGGLGLLLLVALWVALRSAARAARAVSALPEGLGALGERVIGLDRGQAELAGRLQAVTDAQVAQSARMQEVMERRLEEVSHAMGESLHGSTTRTARSLGALQARLATIDKAQEKIEKLSGDVLGLQDILSNKQARGAFGEIQLRDIVTAALPADAFGFQVTLSNGRRADCVVTLPDPPGPLVIDAKFPLEAWEAWRKAADDRARAEAERAFRSAVRTHMRAIAERYLLPGETGEGALMFLPSEAVYADLHSAFPDLVREGFGLRVWTVSPTTCMATLTTLRAVLKDARLAAHAGEIRRELGLLQADLARLGERTGRLQTHFGQAARDLEAIGISARKATSRAARLEDLDFGDDTVVPLVRSGDDR